MQDEIIKLGQFKLMTENFPVKININDLKIGVNSLKNHFVIINENYEVESVIDKICDHAGGRLIKKGSFAICPMHGWKLDFNSLKYQDSHIKKTNIDFSIDNNILKFDDQKSYLVNPYKVVKNQNDLQVRWLNHATTYISNNNISLITDPWLMGPAFLTGWWLEETSSTDSLNLLNDADFIYISHNHPDHLHPETLSLIDKDRKIIVGDFSSKSTQKYLESLGFNNIYALEFNTIYELHEDFQISIFKSGDFRDDSGIYLNIGGIESLLTVDSNFLNSYVLPRNIDLLLTSFASGASGFPLCYNNYSLEEKNKILKRNRLAIMSSVLGYIKSTKPRYYMPYAGMFKEKSERDFFIRENNIKNSIEVFKNIAEENGITFLQPKKNISYNFFNDKFISKNLDITYLPADITEDYIEDYKLKYNYDSNKIIDYLQESGFNSNQIVYIIPTNDDFSKITNDIIYCNFKTQLFKVISFDEIVKDLEGYKTMQLSIREEIFAAVVQNKLPWEDFSIGFQMRVIRYPNEYESKFWYHFTNIYINAIHYKSDPNCGACSVLNQNPIFNKIYK